MIISPFDLPGRFYKGNLHTHSTESDGMLSPADLTEAYRLRGYDFLTISDHFMDRFGWSITDSRPFQTDTFSTLIGAELHVPRTSKWEIWHLLAVGLPLDFARPSANENGPEIAARAAAAGAFVGIAHPAWYGLTEEDANTITAAHAVEIYNNNCELGFDKGDGWGLLDNLLLQGRRLTGFASDDAHFKFPDAFGGWIQVRAKSNDPASILSSLKQGHYYSSQGPEIHSIEITADQIIIRSSPIQRVSAGWHGNKSVCSVSADQTLTILERKPVSEVPRLRITITDRYGRKAWSNPIWMDTVSLET
ncbi:phosphotransferase (plasmid) [Rhizobium leguminosarum]|nr:phosphotransferase [Rhizobium leguminosarum]API55320.1 phosphotransferase [Rhizobium leguminosarum]KZB02848.1 phosphotransferase [Rhizobium leguminosarum]NKM21965.1 phosphotransferase [Rhizobium laguerreae]